VPARAAVARARPRDLESEATRRTILDAAEELLAAGGETRLSIRELCARAGVTPPTVYHHFGDKRALVDRVVEACFAEFDGALARRAAPSDPVEALRWAFDRYVEYGLAHPTHYRLMFQRTGPRKTAAGLASYDRLRRMVAAVADAGRLAATVEAATRACWCTAHGVTSLLVGGYFAPDDPAVALVRDGLVAHITEPALAPRPSRARSQKRSRS
jgi:AcrR family transcriptional regulator